MGGFIDFEPALLQLNIFLNHKMFKILVNLCFIVP